MQDTREFYKQAILQFENLPHRFADDDKPVLINKGKVIERNAFEHIHYRAFEYIHYKWEDYSKDTESALSELFLNESKRMYGVFKKFNLKPGELVLRVIKYNIPRRFGLHLDPNFATTVISKVNTDFDVTDINKVHWGKQAEFMGIKKATPHYYNPGRFTGYSFVMFGSLHHSVLLKDNSRYWTAGDYLSTLYHPQLKNKYKRM